MSGFQPREEYWITTIKECKAATHPIADALIELLIREELTLKQASVKLGMKAGHLQFYLRRLLETKLIRLTRKKDTGRNLEKYYRAVAKHYRFDTKIFKYGTADYNEMKGLAYGNISKWIDTFVTKFRKTGFEEEEARKHHVWTRGIKIPAEKYGELISDMDKVIKKYSEQKSRNGKYLDYQLVTGLFPLLYMDKFKLKPPENL